jgi:hypothetical protein
MSPYTLRGGGQVGSLCTCPCLASGSQCFASVALLALAGIRELASFRGCRTKLQGLLKANLVKHLCLAVVLWTRIGKEIL